MQSCSQRVQVIYSPEITHQDGGHSRQTLLQTLCFPKEQESLQHWLILVAFAIQSQLPLTLLIDFAVKLNITYY